MSRAPTRRAARLRLLEYAPELVPDGGSLVACQLAGPVPYAFKEPAGKCFQEKLLRQQGLLGEGGVGALGNGLRQRPVGPAAARDGKHDGFVFLIVLMLPARALPPRAAGAGHGSRHYRWARVPSLSSPLQPSPLRPRSHRMFSPDVDDDAVLFSARSGHGA